LGGEFVNGAPSETLGTLAWVKSRASSPSGNCVELARLPDGQCAVRNSRDRQGPALVFTTAELGAFVDGAKRGEFDPLIG
jgi:hypothetical protein